MNVRLAALLSVLALLGARGSASALTAVLPDGRIVSPEGFTVPVEGFASAHALSPDGKWLAVVAEDGDAIDIISLGTSRLAARLAIATPNGIAWTDDGLFVARSYSGVVAHFAYAPGAGGSPKLTKSGDLAAGGPGLVTGVTEDIATHRIFVARSADHAIAVVDALTGKLTATLPASGEPYGVAFAHGTTFASLYNSDHIDAWRGDASTRTSVATGPHPTALLVDGDRVFVANADGHDVVAIDAATLAVTKRYDLAIGSDPPPGQTPSGMAISNDSTTLFVAESGFNDVAVVDLATARVVGRIPTAWYPTAVAFVAKTTVGKKDARVKPQLWITTAQGYGSQPNPTGEWNGTYTGLVEHVLVEPQRFAEWSATVARNDRFQPAQQSPASIPPIRHVVFIVRENKHFDEEFADIPGTNGDANLLLYGRAITPNAHALAERYTVFDNFMGNGEASIYGHAWTTQAIANDYHERNAHMRDEEPTAPIASVAWSIWPYPVAGDDSVPPGDLDFDWFKDLADLPHAPRVNVSGVFGPRGELIDELERAGISFRVYGEQMTMAPDGRIHDGLPAHADREYPGDHINFGVLDTQRAKLFLDDVAAHSLTQYTYITLPTDHTAGSKAGFYTPESFIANNDLALGQILDGLSKRPEWKSTVVFVTTDDAQGTGDHVDAHRMPAFAVGPYVRRNFVDHTRYSIASILRTVEVLYGVAPLSVYDAASAPMLTAFARQPLAESYEALPSSVPLERNPGKATSMLMDLDGPDSEAIPDQEWASLRGARSLAFHREYLSRLSGAATVATAEDEH